MALENDTPPVRPLTLFALPQAWGAEPVPLRHYMPVLAALVMLPAGGQVWAQGLFILSVGIALWRKPPRASLSRQLDAFSLAALVIVLLTFLPYFIYRFIPLRWLKQGNWRFRIEQADIHSSMLYTPQPLITLEAFMLLMSVLALIALLVRAPLYNAQRWRFALLLVAGLTALAALGLLGGSTAGGTAPLPALHWAVFPNFATAMAIGSILAFALFLSAVKERWIAGIPLMGLCLLLCATALVLSGSGLWSWTALAAIFWIMLRTVRARRLPGLLRAVSVLVFITAAALVIIGHVEDAPWVLNSENSSQRILRYYDSATIVMQQSAMGIGLGNFKYVFPFYQSRSLAQGAIDSPGNDWLLLSAESGTFGLSVFGLLACALLFVTLGKSRRQAGAVRQAALCALLIFVAGSIVQSPGHYLGTVLLGVVCLQISRPSRADDKKRSLYPRWVWKLQGFALALTGLLFVCASVFSLPWQSDIAIATAAKGMEQGIADKDIEKVEASAARWLRFTPLAWQPYMERGRAQVLLRRDLVKGKTDMNRTLTLIPNLADPPFRLGVLWLPHSVHESEESFRLALERHSPDAGRLYADIVATTAADNRFQQALTRLSRTNPQMRFAYLQGIQQNRFNNALAEELRNDATLRRFSEEQRRQLIERWAREGNTRTAIQYLEQYPDVVTYSWFLRGVALAKLGSLKEACELFDHSLPMAQIPVILQPASLRAEMPVAGFRMPQTDSAAAYPAEPIQGNGNLSHLQATALLRQQLDAQQWDAARQTTAKLLALDNPPAYAVYWSAWLHQRAGEYRQAWPLLEQYARYYLERRWQEQAAELRGELAATPSLSTKAFERWGQITPEESENTEGKE